MANADRWAANMTGAAYTITGDTPIQVADRAAAVISERNWRLSGL
jgi:hypothetical protein